jgi:hypothetical protein
VYEFDAADVGRSYIYPAMARSFRKAGIQWATHFAYDPTYMAFANTEYNTHFMNLVYAPQKALSLKLASEVFHLVPMYKDYGKYPANKQFDAFSVSYENDLAEMKTEKKFIYTNHTKSVPPAPEKLEEIAGFGNSPVVSYEGSGVYFLDKIEQGLWRLEVMPDAIWVGNPFGRNSLGKEVAVVNWRSWPMTIHLPDLGKDFNIKPVNNGNVFNPKVESTTFSIAPGTYLLTGRDKNPKWKGDEPWRNIIINEFSAPKPTIKKLYVIHLPASEVTPGTSYTIKAKIVSVTVPETVEVSIFAGFRPEIYTMHRTSGYDYEVTIPGDHVREGFLRYYIMVTNGGKTLTYPCESEGTPRDWDFYNREPFEVKVVPPSSPIYLFDTSSDHNRLSRVWARGVSIVPKSEPARAELRISMEKLPTAGESKVNDYSMRFCFNDKLTGRREDLTRMKDIVFHGMSTDGKPSWLQVALITKSGAAYGGVIEIGTTSTDYSIALSELKEVKLVSLPRPYPTFLPYFFEGSASEPFDISQIETLQMSIGPGIPEESMASGLGVAIENVRLN